jgi:hypothetical protein
MGCSQPVRITPERDQLLVAWTDRANKAGIRDEIGNGPAAVDAKTVRAVRNKTHAERGGILLTFFSF